MSKHEFLNTPFVELLVMLEHLLSKAALETDRWAIGMADFRNAHLSRRGDPYTPQEFGAREPERLPEDAHLWELADNIGTALKSRDFKNLPRWAVRKKKPRVKNAKPRDRKR